ncbi:sensor histidine kinase [Jatrophihabitans telluris]|uniref:Sensor histidine kinase n=1 Tax=Jatrophihabitans telluris TaxID=2038343 RepID=A0ABY4R0D2_9ACTN|nr:sensor histidine kinase [Jatrophihabitans telluris]UQX88927.1 sensor histidine kinase [Jatrophihabitans telluris]
MTTANRPAASAGTDRPSVVSARPGWAKGWLRFVFPGVFLIYLIQTAGGVARYSRQPWDCVGWLILVVFCASYLYAVATGMSGEHHERFWRLYALMLLLCAVELVFAHADAFVMLVYVSVLSVAARYGKSFPVLACYVGLSIAVPLAIPSWRAHFDPSIPVAIAIVSLAMFGFFGLMRANGALEEARAEVARLAAEGERTRIARDLHDLLGHSLTTITVKAGLARRLAELDPAKAALEIAEVEALARQTLTDVRAAVSGYREVTLGNELAAAREVLRAAGIAAVLPGAIDSVPNGHSELFAWVIREGVTNVVRHSRASHCEIRLTPSSVEISDDGIGGACESGNGLTGLSERVGAAGGRLTVGTAAQDERSRPGWHVLVELNR